MIEEYTITENITRDMIYIPAGSFVQGSDLPEIEECVEYWGDKLVEESFTKDVFRQWIMKEYPPFRVDINAFYLSKYPVTNSQYAKFVNATGSRAPESLVLDKPWNHPVWGINLEDIDRFLKWLNKNSAISFRLPSESEWEYAARGADNNDYPFGKTFNCHYCNTIESGINDTTPVDIYEQYHSYFGICDMAGNVEEWTSTYYSSYQNGIFIEDDLVKTLGQNYPVTRGGSFNRGGDLARCARRHGPYPSPDYKYIGFRIAANNINKNERK